MTDYDAKRAELDKALASAAPNAGILLGIDLYNEFAKRQWMTKEIFSAFGTGAFPEALPAYQKRYVVADWELPPDEFRVKRAEA